MDIEEDAEAGKDRSEDEHPKRQILLRRVAERIKRHEGKESPRDEKLKERRIEGESFPQLANTKSVKFDADGDWNLAIGGKQWGVRKRQKRSGHQHHMYV